MYNQYNSHWSIHSIYKASTLCQFHYWHTEGLTFPDIEDSWYVIHQYQTGAAYYDISLVVQNRATGCWDSIPVTSPLLVEYFKGLYVPNALAPNGNSGEPAYFLPKGKSLKEYRLQIFDTWGNMVWETSAVSVPDGKPIYPWKGTTLDDKPLPQGTYIWKIYAKFTNGTVWPGINGETIGPIYLIR